MAAIQRWSKGPTGTVVLLAQEIHRQQVVRVAMMGKDNKLNMLRFEVDRICRLLYKLYYNFLEQAAAEPCLEGSRVSLAAFGRDSDVVI